LRQKKNSIGQNKIEAHLRVFLVDFKHRTHALASYSSFASIGGSSKIVTTQNMLTIHSPIQISQTEFDQWSICIAQQQIMQPTAHS